MKQKKKLLYLTGLAVFLGTVQTAKADLIGLTMQFPVIDLNNSYLIYDHNGVNNSTGLLKVVSFGSTLVDGPGITGGNSLSQVYTDNSESTPDVMLTIAINKSNGAWSNSTANGANKVTIGFGNSVIENAPATTPGFSWAGDITGFGWQENIGRKNKAPYEYGTSFDATWKFTNDDYEDMPAGMGEFVDGILTNAMTAYDGGIKISNSAGFGNVPHPKAFQRDWVFGTSANTNGIKDLLDPYLGDLSTSTCKKRDSTNCMTYVNSTVFADVFVPIPPALFLWAGALATLLPSLRRLKSNTLTETSGTRA